MKKHLFVVAALAAGMSINAQYTQTLPLDYTDFFRADAIAEDGKHLERGAYANNTQGDATPLMADQWNLSGKTDNQGLTNPEIVTNDLSWGQYIDNAKGKAIIFVGKETGTRYSSYSLKKNNDYSSADASKSFYLAFLINFSKISSSDGAEFLAFDGNYTVNTARARVGAKMIKDAEEKNIGYQLGIDYANSKPSVFSETLNYGETHLAVVKITPNKNKGTNDEAATLWLDPDLTKDEAGNDAAKIGDVIGNGIGSVRGIDIVQRKNIAGKVAGLRFGDNWADVVKEAPEDPTAIDNVNVNAKAEKVMINGQLFIRKNGELFNITGAKVK